MKLDTYLKEHGLSDGDFAAEVGRDRTTVLRWRRDDARPDWPALQKVLEATGGKVTPNDFLPSLTTHATEATQ